MLAAALTVIGASAATPVAPLRAATPIAPLRIHGLVAATLTAFNATGGLDLGVVPKQAAYLKSTGVNWTFVAGTTGESLSLSVSERKALYKAWVDAGSNVIAHAGAESVVDARELAAHAEKVGAKAVGVMAPTFFKPASPDALAAMVAAVCAAAPTLPCYYYHIPSMTGIKVDMYDFVKAIEPLSPSFAGLKWTGMFTGNGLRGAQRVLNYKKGKYKVLSGREGTFLASLAVGIDGFVGSQYNFAGDLFNTLQEKYEKGGGVTPSTQTELRGLQSSAIDLIHAWLDATPPGGHNGMKYFMKLAGVDVGDARLPTLPLDAAGRSSLKTAWTSFCKSNANLKLRMCEAA